MALGVSKIRETLPTNSQLNTRVLFITYQSWRYQDHGSADQRLAKGDGELGEGYRLISTNAMKVGQTAKGSSARLLRKC